MPQVIQDSIVIKLQVEDTIKATKANLVVSVEMVLQNKTTEEGRADILSGLQSIVNTNWDIANIHRFNDSSGLEKWNVLAQIRVTETELGDLTGKCQNASRPGLQFKVKNVSYIPSVEEYETFYSLLRTKLYTKIKNEIKVIFDETGQKFRIGNANFGISGTEAINPFDVSKFYSGNSAPEPHRKGGGAQIMACAASTSITNSSNFYGNGGNNGDDGTSSPSEGNSGGDFSVSQKITMIANVNLASIVGVATERDWIADC